MAAFDDWAARLEPEAVERARVAGDNADVDRWSVAISMKRIADALERIITLASEEPKGESG